MGNVIGVRSRLQTSVLSNHSPISDAPIAIATKPNGLDAPVLRL
ncbi:hypothetical protein [Spirulina subsalsa]|nr:hypothetical protein [Spirulina subsalsa]